MRPYRRASVLAICLASGLLLVPDPAFPGIGENFEAAGTAFSGGLNMNFSLGRIFDLDNEEYSVAVELSPSVLFFFRDNLAFSVVPLLRFRHDHENDNNIRTTLVLGLGGGLAYYAVRNPEADTGVVPSVGLTLGAAAIPGLDYTFLGSKVDNKAFSIPVFLEIPIKLLYFVKPRVAPELSIVPRLSIPVYAKDESGQVIDTPLLKRIRLETDFYLGVTWFFPPREVTLLEKK
jgi:hypothetical protein